MARKTFNVSTYVKMCNNILTSEEFCQYDKELVSAMLESVLDKSGNDYVIESVGEDEYSRKYVLK